MQESSLYLGKNDDRPSVVRCDLDLGTVTLQAPVTPDDIRLISQQAMETGTIELTFSPEAAAALGEQLAGMAETCRRWAVRPCLGRNSISRLVLPGDGEAGPVVVGGVSVIEDDGEA